MMDVLDPPPVPDLDPARLAELRAGLTAEIARRPSRRTRPTARTVAVAGAVAAAAAVAVVIAAVRTPDPSDGPAAGPALVPITTPTGATRATLVEECRSSFKPLPTAPDAGSKYPTFWRDAKAVLVNTYDGGGTSDVVLHVDDVYASCLGRRASGAADDSYDSLGLTGPRTTAPRPGGATVVAVDFPGDYDPNRFADRHADWVVGRAGPQVAAITVRLHDGRTLDAVVGADGWWQAWTSPNSVQTSPPSDDHPGGGVRRFPIDVTVTSLDGAEYRRTFTQR